MPRASGDCGGSNGPQHEQDPRDVRIEQLERENTRLIGDLAQTGSERDQWKRRSERLIEERDHWKRHSEHLEKQLDAARRAGKRQAAPFAKDRPQGRGGRPGRRAGADYGTHGCRRRPTRVDETHAAPVPTACPDCGGEVEVTRVASQYQEDLPQVEPIVRHFKIEVGQCSQCRRRVQGRHRFADLRCAGRGRRAARPERGGPGGRVAHRDGAAAGEGQRASADAVRP